MSIRPATVADVDALARLRHRLWPRGSEDEHRRETAASLEAPAGDEAVLLAVHDDEVLGFAELSIRRYAEGCDTDRVGFLEGWFVREDVRGQGIGGRLVLAAEQWARSRGCTEFASDTEVDNEASAAAHRALGFDDAGVIRCFRKNL